jgi:hypothetical protein
VSDGDAVEALAAARCWRMWATAPTAGDPEMLRAADDLEWLAERGWRLVRYGGGDSRLAGLLRSEADDYRAAFSGVSNSHFAEGYCVALERVADLLDGGR